MKWYDYGWCLLFADLISASIVSLNILGFALGGLLYMMYEKIRVMKKELD